MNNLSKKLKLTNNKTINKKKLKLQKLKKDNLIKKEMPNDISIKLKSPNLKFYTDFYATGIVKLYRTWLRGDTNLTQEQLTNIVSRACFLSVEELTKNRK